MNRQERRALKKKMKGRDARSIATDILNRLENELGNPLRDGDQVVLKVDQIIGRKDYAQLQEQYRQFVEGSRGRVFTAHPFRPRADGYSAVMQLDGTEWTFWYGDLALAEKGV